jgi:DNA-binding CsgD family transcriptional regulator
MSITTPSIPSERRDQSRRSDDRADDYLHKTFSTHYCHSCLERVADGVLLLDSETRVIYSTPQVDKLMKRHDSPFTLSPKFTLHHPRHAALFAAFVNGKNHEAGPFSLLLEDENAGGGDLLLLNCIRFPEPAEPDCQAAHYMITLCDPNHCPSQKLLLFKKQFNLTPAEARLCRSFADGMTLNDYCEKWNVATSTARSQLHSVFGKTSTHRQSDLLRLIFLFSRI